VRRSGKRAVAWLGALAVLAACALLVAYGFSHGYLRFNYPSLARYPVQGVDVSHHQGDIRWSALKSRRVRFAYIKATEGATFQDSAFATNWRGAAAAGIVPGAYHYFTLCRSGADQAANFIATTNLVAGIGLPPAVDLEFGGNCAHRPTVEAFEAELQVFLTTVSEQLGCRPVLYVTEDFYGPYVEGRFPGYPVWIREMHGEPRLPPGRRWTLWQFADHARNAAIPEIFVDLDVFHGSEKEFAAFRCDPPAHG
jgi:lysozyme